MGMSWVEFVSWAKDIWWVLSAPVAAIGLAGMYYLRGQFPTKTTFDNQIEAVTTSISDLSKKIDDNEKKTSERIVKSERETSERMAKLESDVRQLPGRTEMEHLSDRISRVETQVAASVETIKGVEKTANKIDRTLEMILGHMLDEKREKIG
ncbi:conserved hypothetical protein [Rhodopseudomonas palustris TIE-1]|uniref:hypothetical protein n=1 Tax=Rhodopseudomonas palustris TaxID=1076 RepID=UPI000164ACC8|nr:hypothetical protein [Rhodopseudomonas palustris]ACE99226.1 conserved hypothetical protein [Rhodopseudomonas palustris TIE-1]